MKLWMILYVGTQIGGVWGPLPYDKDECEARATLQNKNFEWAQTDTATQQKANAQGISDPFKGWKMVCEDHEQRPQLTEK